MKLTNNLYTITDRQHENLQSVYHVELNKECFIYKAHFPGQPITPGVCIVQMAKELLEESLQKPLDIVAVKNVKFLSVISPNSTPQLTVVLSPKNPSDDGKIACSAVIKAGETVMTKISFTCQEHGAN